MPIHTLHRIVVASIFHIPRMMAAREIRECVELINKVTYKPAKDLSSGWKSTEGCSSRLPGSENEFSSFARRTRNGKK